MRQEPIFIMFSEEKATFSALQNNGRVCAVFLICISSRQAASPARPSGQHALALSQAQDQEAGLEGQKAQPAKVKAGLCPCLCSPCRRGSSSLRGSTGVEVGPRPMMVTPQIIPSQPPATARWREAAAGQEPKKVQNQARGPSWQASVQLWFCAREVTALICL